MESESNMGSAYFPSIAADHEFGPGGVKENLVKPRQSMDFGLLKTLGRDGINMLLEDSETLDNLPSELSPMIEVANVSAKQSLLRLFSDMLPVELHLLETKGIVPEDLVPELYGRLAATLTKHELDGLKGYCKLPMRIADALSRELDLKTTVIDDCNRLLFKSEEERIEGMALMEYASEMEVGNSMPNRIGVLPGREKGMIDAPITATYSILDETETTDGTLNIFCGDNVRSEQYVIRYTPFFNELYLTDFVNDDEPHKLKTAPAICGLMRELLRADVRLDALLPVYSISSRNMIKYLENPELLKTYVELAKSQPIESEHVEAYEAYCLHVDNACLDERINIIVPKAYKSAPRRANHTIPEPVRKRSAQYVHAEIPDHLPESAVSDDPLDDVELADFQSKPASMEYYIDDSINTFRRSIRDAKLEAEMHEKKEAYSPKSLFNWLG